MGVKVLQMIPLDARNQILDPLNFIKRFPNRESFIAWLNPHSIKDLREILDTFEKYELYEYCSVVKWVVDKKKDDLLNKLGISIL